MNNYSALGQNLETSNSLGEIIFAIIICVSGVLLFAVLIGNVQVIKNPHIIIDFDLVYLIIIDFDHNRGTCNQLR